MPEKNSKTKDMVIAIFCTLLVVLAIVAYFLPAFTVKHKANPSSDFEICNYSAWEMTKSVFTDAKVLSSNMIGLQYIKDTYAFPIIAAGLLLPLGIICSAVTTVFAYISWLKDSKFKKFCFLFSLCGMIFTTITLICTWFVAIMIRDGNNFGYFNFNLKGSIAYGSFISLIVAFVVAIIACAYNYFLDNFDEEFDEEDDEDEEEQEEVRLSKKLATANSAPDENQEKQVTVKRTVKTEDDKVVEKTEEIKVVDKKVVKEAKPSQRKTTK